MECKLSFSYQFLNRDEELFLNGKNPSEVIIAVVKRNLSEVEDRDIHLLAETISAQIKEGIVIEEDIIRVYKALDLTAVR